MGGARVVKALALAVLCLPAAAAADPCARGALPAPTPIGLSTASADFATTPSACAERRADLAGHAALLVDEPDFYGMLVGDVGLSGGFALAETFWLTASFAAIEHRFVQNATIVATSTSLGAATLGAHVAALRTDRWQVAPYVRALLPTGTALEYAIALGGEPGVSAVFAASARWSFAFGASTPATWTLLGSRMRSTLEPRIDAEAAFAPWNWLEPAAGLEVRIGGDAAGALEAIAPSLALRFYPWRDLQANVALVLPLVGEDRTDGRLRVGAGWVF